MTTIVSKRVARWLFSAAGFAEGAVTTALNAVWGVLNHLGGATMPGKPGTGRPVRRAGARGAALPTRAGS
jgi:hypothetical protein